MTNVPAICRAMKTVLETIPGLTVAYPKPERISQSPTAVILWGSQGQPTTIEHSAGMQDWTAIVTVQLLVDHRDATPTEVERIYGLVTPIGDAFAIGDYGGVPTAMDGLCGHCLLVSVDPEWQVPYGGVFCYGANLTFEIGFTRTPGLE